MKPQRDRDGVASKAEGCTRWPFGRHVDALFQSSNVMANSSRPKAQPSLSPDVSSETSCKTRSWISKNGTGVDTHRASNGLHNGTSAQCRGGALGVLRAPACTLSNRGDAIILSA